MSAHNSTQSALPIEELVPTAKQCAKRIQEADGVLLVSHIDADGLTSAGVASTMLERSGTPFETQFCKQLDEHEISQIAKTEYDTVLFTDFGSGQLDIISEYESDGAFTPIIADHHKPADADTEYHLNPLVCSDIDGSSELSGAGTTYVLARAMSTVDSDSKPANEQSPSESNKDLSAIALVGAIGDMQGGPDGVTGANTEIVAEGVEAGVIEQQKDITLYGKQTRPVPKMLEFSTDIRIPGITGSQSGAIKFLDKCGLELKDETGQWKHWADLTEDEKQTVVSNLINTAISKGVPSSRINELVGTTYELSGEEPRTSLRDVSEFSTLLNATARYERADVGLAVCLGDREEALKEAKTLLQNHQQNISQGINWVTENGVTHEDNLQWFDSEDRIRETIVGIVAGMALGEGNADQHTPIIAFADKPQDNEKAETDGEPIQEVKISARATRKLTRDGVDLSVVMGEASRSVGGDGGGHDIAAGATIPASKRDEFISKADEILEKQLS